MTKEKLKEEIEALKQKAKDSAHVKWPRPVKGRSSLHAIIRTPEQAKRFMKMLNDAHRPSD